MSDESEHDNDDGYYESGPYCVHWCTPWDCETSCLRCGLACKDHDYGTDNGACEEFED